MCSTYGQRPVESYVREMEAETGVTVTSFASSDQAARDADLIFSATTAETALINNTSIQQGTTVVSIGSYQELDDEFILTADKVIVDDLEQCRHRGRVGPLV